MLIFRWSAWGSINISMLNHSIGTFLHFFESEARFIVFTDNPDRVIAGIKVPAEVYSYESVEHPTYLDTEVSTWRKWAPACRLDISATEIRVDADMFLLSEPTELKFFCSTENTTRKFLVTTEHFKGLWPYGNFGPQLPENFLPINAGLIGQYQGADLSMPLAKAYHWSKKNIPYAQAKFHDEQGAVAFALQPFVQREEVFLLSPERYRIISPRDPVPPTLLDGIVMLHATYPTHPAFYQFIREISSISGLEASC
jgi:hypothetical protein